MTWPTLHDKGWSSSLRSKVHRALHHIHHIKKKEFGMSWISTGWRDSNIHHLGSLSGTSTVNGCGRSLSVYSHLALLSVISPVKDHNYQYKMLPLGLSKQCVHNSIGRDNRLAEESRNRPEHTNRWAKMSEDGQLWVIIGLRAISSWYPGCSSRPTCFLLKHEEKTVLHERSRPRNTRNTCSSS